jgi:transcriptional regulator with XRE-family HTH domain
MKKQTLGGAIKQARTSRQLSQQQLGEEIGTTGSHIAYIESGQTRPSLRLLSLMADELGLDKKQLFLLFHPEAQNFVSSNRPAVRPNQAWQQFLLNGALLRKNKVTPAELRVLKQVDMLGVVISSRMFLFVLHSIRQSLLRSSPADTSKSLLNYRSDSRSPSSVISTDLAFPAGSDMKPF